MFKRWVSSKKVNDCVSGQDCKQKKTDKTRDVIVRSRSEGGRDKRVDEGYSFSDGVGPSGYGSVISHISAKGSTSKPGDRFTWSEGAWVRGTED